MKVKAFTLIELIMVIVLLGVLAAFALPRFADLGSGARASSLQGLASALRAAAEIAHMKQVADDKLAADQISLQGADVAMTSSYPAASVSGIVVAAQVALDDYAITDGGEAVGDQIVFSLLVSGDGNNDGDTIDCRLIYQATQNEPNIQLYLEDC